MKNLLKFLLVLVVAGFLALKYLWFAIVLGSSIAGAGFTCYGIFYFLMDPLAKIMEWKVPKGDDDEIFYHPAVLLMLGSWLLLTLLGVVVQWNRKAKSVPEEAG